MLSKNFEKLRDYNIFESDIISREIFDNIKKIEQDSKNKKFFNLGNLVRTTAETILANFYDFQGEYGKLVYKVEKTVYLPPNIRTQLMNIMNLTNPNSHGITNKSNIIYKIDFTYEDVISSLRSLWFLLKFLILSRFPDESNIKDSNFDNSLYEKYENIENLKNKEIENTNNDISAHLMTISQFVMLKEYNFNIPTYQRDYTWNKENIEKFTNDIEKRSFDNKTHYLGSVAVAQDSENKIFRIIDGQQRITTALIILKTFDDVFKLKKMDTPDELDEFINNKISNIYINQKVLDSQKAVEKVLEGNMATSEPSQKNSNAFKNYIFILEWLKNKNNNEISTLYSIFVTRFQVEALVFNTSIENEMDIFENLNTGGTVLKPWELIKNYIYSKLEPKKFMNKEIDLNRYINQTFAIPLSLSNQNKIAQKLSDFFVIYNRYISIIQKNEVWTDRKNSYNKFKEIWPNNKHKFDDYDEYIIKINEIRKIFNIYLVLKTQKKYQNNSSIFYPFYHTLDTIVKDDTLPLLIYSIVKFVNFNHHDKIVGFKNPKKFYSLIKSIEKYLVKLGVVKGFGHSQSQDFDNFLLKHKNSSELDKEFDLYVNKDIGIPIPTDDEFFEAIRTSGSIKKSFILNILINIERELRDLRYNQSPHNPFEKTREHILAEKLNYENYEGKISEENFYEQLKRWLNSIGNGLILSRSENSLAGNQKFTNKKYLYKNKKLATGNSELMNLLEKNSFTFEDIEERAFQIAKIAIKVYK